MAQSLSNSQLPIGAPSADAEHARAFQRGLELGREYADTALRRIAAWTEEHPGQALLAALAAGFVLGKIFFRPRRTIIEKMD